MAKLVGKNIVKPGKQAGKEEDEKTSSSAAKKKTAKK